MQNYATAAGVITFAYDSSGRLSAMTDELGNVATWTWGTHTIAGVPDLTRGCQARGMGSAKSNGAGSQGALHQKNHNAKRVVSRSVTVAVRCKRSFFPKRQKGVQFTGSLSFRFQAKRNVCQHKEL